MTTTPTILLVEDDPDQASLFGRVLKLAGYQVATVATAEEALEQLASSPFSLLLADWNLPGMKGDTLVRQAKTQYPQMKTILFSNHANVDQAAATSEADAWFRKIEGIARLRQIIHKVLPHNSDYA